jgi:hypothetical protein
MFLKIDFTKGRGFMRVFPALCLLFLLTGCAQLDTGLPDAVLVKDAALSAEETIWLQEGSQSKITPKILQASSRIKGQSRRELFYKTVDYIRYHFKYDNWYLDKAFTLTADEIFRSGVMGGCSDFALVEVSLLRALGVPARMVLTLNTEWISAYKTNDLLIPRGHVFIEVYLENGWHLFDPAWGVLYKGYDSDIKSLPRKEYFIARSIDFWDAGIRSVADLIKNYRRFVSAFDLSQYTPPRYLKIKITAHHRFSHFSNQEGF